MSEATARNRINYRRPSSALATVDSAATLVRRLRAEGDFYVEPRWSVDALLDVEAFPGLTWDPACGKGTIPDAMQARGLRVWGSDIIDRGWAGWSGARDFLTVDTLSFRPDHIVCNPPFKLAERFVERGLAFATNKVALLLRLSFLEGQRRGDLFAQTPLARVWVFSSRVSMPPGDLEVKPQGGAVAFAWLVWQHGWRGPPQLGWLRKR